MVTASAARIAAYLEPRISGLKKEVLAKLGREEAKHVEPFLEDWIQGLIDYLRGGADRTGEWTALLASRAPSHGAALQLALGQMRVFRESVLAFCRGKVEGVSDGDLTDLALDLAGSQEAHLAAYCSHAECQAQASERRRQRLIADAMDRPYATLAPDGTIDIANRQFGLTLEVPRDSVEGRKIGDLCGAGTAAEMRRALRKKRLSSTHSFEGDLLTTKGKAVPGRFQARPMFDAQGRRDGVALTFDHGEEPLSREEAFMLHVVSRLAAVVPAVVEVFDRDGRVIYRNNTCTDLLPEEWDAGHALCCRLIGSEAQRREMNPPCPHVLLSGVPYQGEVQLDDGGKARFFQAWAVPVQETNGEVTRVACALLDITNFRNLERQVLEQQRTSLASQLAVTVAHQIRNPLSVMVGFAEMLSEGLPSERVPSAVDKMLRNGIRCKEIVEGLLEFGQGFPSEQAPTDLNRLVRQSVQPMIPRAKGRRIQWSFSDEPITVDCVPSQMAPMIAGLLDNALAAATTEVRFELSRKGDLAQIRVSDDGLGVPKELRERIFTPFFTTRKEEGAQGLGLSLSQAVLRESGGRIYITDRPGGGACFVAELPLSYETPPEENTAEDGPEEVAHDRHILVVDDEVDLLDMLKMVLEMRAYRVDTADTATDAIQKIDANSYDALVLDVRLPGDLSGQQLFEYLQGTHPEVTSRTMFITADTMNYDTRRFLERVRRPSMEKPFLVYDFVSEVDGMFGDSNGDG